MPLRTEKINQLRQLYHTGITSTPLFIWTKNIGNIVSFEHSDALQPSRHLGTQGTLSSKLIKDISSYYIL